MDGKKHSEHSEHLDTLKQKLEAMNMILKATKRLTFTGEGNEEQLEKEAELFSSLYEQRADVITKIQKMDEILTKYNTETPETIKITEKIKETAKAIVELDKKHVEISKKHMLFLRGNIKKIRDGRDINNAYVDDTVASSGYYFDRTN